MEAQPLLLRAAFFPRTLTHLLIHPHGTSGRLQTETSQLPDGTGLPVTCTQLSQLHRLQGSVPKRGPCFAAVWTKPRIWVYDTEPELMKHQWQQVPLSTVGYPFTLRRVNSWAQPRL